MKENDGEEIYIYIHINLYVVDESLQSKNMDLPHMFDHCLNLVHAQWVM